MPASPPTVPQQASPPPSPVSGATAVDLPSWSGEDEARRRRARSAERQRMAAEVKRSRAALRRGRSRQERAVRDHRSSLLVMVILLGLLIATVVVSGGLVAASMRTRPITLAAPLHIYPVSRTVPGQCPAGTRGITGQTSTGMACYQLTRGIAIRRVNDLRVQESRTRGQYDVAVTLRAADRQAFATLTRASVGRDVAFVVRDRLVTAPRVDAPVADGKIVITGARSRTEADQLVRSLRGS